MKKLIYHGSEKAITKPSLEFSNRFNDYGIGFYCTDEPELAKEWACRRNADGFANSYFINPEGLKVLDLSSDNKDVLKWIAILLKNRLFRTDTAFTDDARVYVVERFAPNTDDVDIIRGYRADDSYFQYAEAFVENRLPLRVLSKALKLGKLGIQTALVTEKSMERLEFNGEVPVPKTTYYPRFLNRDNKARQDYRKLLNGYKLLKTDVFLYDIIREEMKEDDPRIQRSLFK